MKTLVVVLLLSLVDSLPAGAFQTNQGSPTFEAAANAGSFLKFELETKKLGLFRHTLVGLARKFEAQGEFSGEKLLGARVRFAVKDLDTDLYARNDQMWNFCLGAGENPEIEIKVPGADLPEGKKSLVNGEIKVRGQWRKISLTLQRDSIDGQVVVTGNSDLSLEALGVPDPSIGIANVADTIHVSFRLVDQPSGPHTVQDLTP